jgi:hypothetical protein
MRIYFTIKLGRFELHAEGWPRAAFGVSQGQPGVLFLDVGKVRLIGTNYRRLQVAASAGA